MNISSHGKSIFLPDPCPGKPGSFGTLKNITIDRSSNNSTARLKFEDKISISPEAIAQAQARALDPEVLAETAGGRMLLNYIKPWFNEVFAEAHKNGTSFEEAMKEHGMEIAKFIIGEQMKFPDGINQEFLDDIEAFLDSAARHINGESLKDAFEGYDIEKGMEKYGPALNVSHMARREYFDEASNSKKVGYYSKRHERYVFPPEPSEEIKENAPQKEYSNDAAQQDKNDIFKDFAERMLASLQKKGTESTLHNTAKKENGIANGHVKTGKETISWI
jgi:hypothetical protein